MITVPDFLVTGATEPPTTKVAGFPANYSYWNKIHWAIPVVPTVLTYVMLLLFGVLRLGYL